MRTYLALFLVMPLVFVLAACGTTAEQAPTIESTPTPTVDATSASAEAASGGTDNQQQGEEADQPIEQEATEMQLISSEFEAGSPIPQAYSCDGEDVSPPLGWSDAPEGAVSFALIMDDPDAPGGTWDHWLLFNIPADARSLPRGVPSSEVLDDGSRHGQNSWGRAEYGGPCPPSGTHRYVFKLFALDKMLELEAGAAKADLRNAMEGHILAQAQLIGTFSR